MLQILAGEEQGKLILMYPEFIVNTYIKIGDDFINIFDFNGHIDKRDYSSEYLKNG